jgi:hypothetical protein
MLTKRIAGFSFALALCCFSNAHAQEGFEHFSVAAHGAGGAYTTLSQGIDAIGLNPALLGYEQDHHLQISILPITAFGIDAGSSFRNVSALGSVFGKSNGFINDSTSEHVVDLLSNSKLSGRADVEVLAASLYIPNVGGFGLAWTTHAGLRTDLDQKFLDIFRHAEANLLQGTDTAADFDLQAQWYNEYSLSFGKALISHTLLDSTEATIGSFAIGGAFKYITGVGYMRLDPGNSVSIRHSTNTTYIQTKYSIHFAYPDQFDPTKVPNHFDFSFLSSSTAGTGYGIDLGAHLGVFRSKDGHDALSIAASATDIGSITWTKNTQVRHADTTITINQAGSLSNVNGLIGGLAGKLDDVSSFTSPLPAVLRVGAALDLDAIGISLAGTDLTFAAEYANGLTGLVGSTKNARIGGGVLLNHPGSVFSFRAGLGFSTQSGANEITLGLGTSILNRVSLDISTAKFNELIGSSGSLEIAFSLRVLLL